MNKKTLNIILVVALLGIWGTILMRVLGNESEVIIQGQYHAPITSVVSDTTENDFTLALNYRDPFLGKLPATKKIHKAKTTSKPLVKPIAKPKLPVEIIWPNIVYRGSFRNKKDKLVGLISLDNSDKMVSINQQIGGLSIKKILSDSILIAFKNEEKYIHKANQ